MSVTEDSPVGHLTIVFGPMFSGKSTELLRRVTMWTRVNTRKCALYVNHSIDNRGESVFSTHNPLLKGFTYKSSTNPIRDVDIQNIDSVNEYFDSLEDNEVVYISVSKIEDIEVILRSQRVDYVAIDEGQFYGDLSKIDEYTSTYNIQTVVAGLIADADKNEFGGILSLMPLADDIVHMTSLCVNCATKGVKEDAPFSSRYSLKRKRTSSTLVSETSVEDVVDVGGSEKYTSLCRMCYASVK